MNCTSAADNDRLPRKISPPSASGKNRQGFVDGINQPVSHHYKKHESKRNSKHSSNNNNLPNKRQKFRHEPMDLDPLFPKLDQNDPIHARRIQQRRRAVAIGKNTPGYAEYCKQVPKEKRKPFSMETPPTPDHTLDIPTKRWQGMVNAWRRALHRYDPPDLVTNFNDRTSDSAATKTVTKDGSDDGKSNNVQRRQIEDAVAKGLLVDVSTPVKKTPDTTHMDDEDGIMESPVSVLSEESRRHDVFMDIGNENDVDLLDGDDSDDDLL